MQKTKDRYLVTSNEIWWRGGKRGGGVTFSNYFFRLLIMTDENAKSYSDFQYAANLLRRGIRRLRLCIRKAIFGNRACGAQTRQNAHLYTNIGIQLRYIGVSSGRYRYRQSSITLLIPG